MIIDEIIDYELIKQDQDIILFLVRGEEHLQLGHKVVIFFLNN